jgi:hypothetical protein
MEPTRKPLEASNANNEAVDGEIERRSIFDRVTKGAISGVAAAALAVGLALPNNAAAQEPADGLKRFILIGLCEPVDDSAKTLAGFNEWFVNQHVEDVSKTPNFVRSRVYKLGGPHGSGATYTKYISLYEVDAPSWEEAEKVLNAWQRDPNAWEGRAKHTATGKRVGSVLSCPGSGWYEMLNSYDGPAKAATKLD